MTLIELRQHGGGVTSSQHQHSQQQQGTQQQRIQQWHTQQQRQPDCTSQLHVKCLIPCECHDVVKSPTHTCSITDSAHVTPPTTPPSLCAHTHTVDFEDEEEEEEHLTVKQRVQLECGLLHHDASLLLADEPSRHPGVKSAAHHHQTADALTYLPSPAPPGDVGATAAAAAAAAAATAAGEGATHAPDAADASAAADGADSGVVPGVGGDLGAEDVVVSCKGTLSIYRLSAGQVGTV